MTVVSLVVAGAIFAATALWARPFLVLEHRAAIADLAKHNAGLLKSAQSVHRASSYLEVIKLIKSMMVVSPVSGAVLLNNQFQVFKTVGEAPLENFRGFWQQKSTYFETEDGCCIDLFLHKGETGLPYHIVARIKLSGIKARLAEQRQRIFGVLILVLLVAVAMASALLSWIISLPEEKLEPAMETAPEIDAPGHGELIDAVPFMVMSFDDRGRLSGANDPALWFFQCNSLSQLQSTDLCVFRAAKEPDSDIQCLPDLLKNGLFDFPVTIHNRDEPVSYRAIAHIEHNDFGEVRNLIVCLAPPEREAMPCEKSNLQSPAETQALERRVLVLKLLLESCFTLLSKPDTQAIRSAALPVRTDMLVEGWYLDASRHGLINREMEHTVPGQIVGDDSAVKSLIRHALTFIALRSEAETPVLAGSGSVLSANTVEFVFEEVGGPPLSDPSADRPADSQPEDWILPLAALSKLLAAYGGKVQKTRGQGESNLVRFTMRARPASTSDLSANGEKNAA